MVRVLFVCMGNICRSPTAEGVFRKLVAEQGLDGRIESDSAGTTDYHAGEPPDERAQQIARGRGIDLSGIRARAVAARDFTDFDLLLAMDRAVLGTLAAAERRLRLDGGGGTVRLFMDYAPALATDEVPDPYLGGIRGFEYVLDLIEEGAQGLLAELRQGGPG